MTNSCSDLDGWALILGASSGFGAAASIALAQAGCNIVGVHLDRHATLPNSEAVQEKIRAFGREAWFFNTNAADEARRDRVLDEVQSRFQTNREGRAIRVVLHSLAFGTLLPLISEDLKSDMSLKQLEMTTTVMAHSFVSWVQCLVRRDLLARGSRVFAMTSTGAWSVWPEYGAVSAAKAALEAHVRQLAYELRSREITVNAICAGVTETPALRKIPSHKKMIDVALRKNPSGRLTTPEDVAAALVALAQPGTYWLTGNVINVDGGEAAAG